MTDAELIWETEPDQGWTFALLRPSLDRLGVEPRSVLHVGAHRGEELPYYRAAGFRTIVMVEPDPDAADRIPALRPGEHVVVGAVGLSEGPATFHRNAKSYFSGLAERTRGGDRDVATFETTVRRADAIQAEMTDPANVLVVDTQGTEMDALASASLNGLDLVIVEAYGNTGLGRPPMVRCAAPFGELEAHMVAAGWRRRIRWVYDTSGYFDVLYTPREA